MPVNYGTRQKAIVSEISQATRQDNNRESRDVGMSKRVVDTMTFTASNGRITGSNGDFAAFAVNDLIVVYGTNLNNGDREILAIDGTNQAWIQVDVPVKNEGPVAGVEVRTQ